MWRQIVVGDIVEVRNNEEFPADLLLLVSDDPEAKCDVTTANLDGETNLKVSEMWVHLKLIVVLCWFTFGFMY